jgi:solute carrier family 35, member E1
MTVVQPQRSVAGRVAQKAAGSRTSFAKLDSREEELQTDNGSLPVVLELEADNIPVQPAGRCSALLDVQHVVTGLLIVLWYASSIVCNQTSKDLVGAGGVLTSTTLTLAQCAISVVCGLVVMLMESIASRSLPRGYLFRSYHQLLDTALLAVAFTAGFITLNASIASMHISLVMVLRGSEPLTTLLLARVMLPSSAWPTRAKLLAIVPVVVGCALSAIGPHGPTALGLCFVLISNGCFSLRAIFGKRITANHGTTAFPLFWQLCVIGTLMQLVLMALSALAGAAGQPSAAAAAAAAPAAGDGDTASSTAAAQLGTIVLNGASFYAYLQLSFVVLGRISAVSHSVTNSMRRPATIVAALLWQPVDLSPLNYVGLLVACGGSLAYGLV